MTKWEYKVKTFKYLSVHEIETNVNKWLKERDENRFKLINISTVTEDGTFVYTILYKEDIEQSSIRML
jgi:hypothetical protein